MTDKTDFRVYLFSKTAYEGVHYIPILSTDFLQPVIDFTRYDAIVLTSKQAVPALNKISDAWKKIPLLTIADKTAQEARQAGATVMLSGKGYGDPLAQIIIRDFADKRWLYPRPEVVASDFGQKVREAGVQMDEAVVYKTSCNESCSKVALDTQAVLVFTSPFTIACFLKYYHFKPTYKVVAIGKTTAGALPKGVSFEMPQKPTVEAAVKLAQKIAKTSKDTSTF